MDARHQRCKFTDLLHPAIPRHPEFPVGLLASAPDLIPGFEVGLASLRKRFPPTWISWGRGIDVNRWDTNGSSAPPSDFGSPLQTIREIQSTSTLPLARLCREIPPYQQIPTRAASFEGYSEYFEGHPVCISWASNNHPLEPLTRFPLIAIVCPSSKPSGTTTSE